MNEKAGKMSKEHRLIEALGSRAYYLEKIREVQAVIENEAKFGELTVYQLIQKRERINTLFDNFENIGGEAQTRDEDSKIETICEALKAKIDSKIDALKKPAEVQPKIGLEHYTIQKTSRYQHLKMRYKLKRLTVNSMNGSNLLSNLKQKSMQKTLMKQKNCHC